MDARLPQLPAEPTVTVIVPSYSQGAFINDTLQSILRQDYPRTEVWVIDGGSSDETRDVLARYDDDERVHWLSEPDRGYADAVNKGLERARGELVGIQSSDDFYAPGAVAEAVALFRRYPELVMVSGTFYRVDEKGAPFAYTRAVHAREWLTVEQCARTLNFPCQSACFFRRDLAREVGGCDFEVDWVADHDLYVRMMAAGARHGGRTLKLDRFWSYVRQHPGQRNAARFKFVRATIRAHRRYDDRLRDLLTPRERRLLLQTAYTGEYEFRTRRMKQDVWALPAFVRMLQHTVEPRPGTWYLGELLRMAPFGLGRRLIEGLSWRMEMLRNRRAGGPDLPVSARWFA